MSTLIIHIAELKDFSQEALDQLTTMGTLRLQEIKPHEVKASLEHCDVFWFRLGFKITRNDFSLDTRCKVIICPVTGLDHIDLVACEHAGIKVLSLKGESEFLKSIRATAELTIGLTLALLRHIPDAVQSANQSIWNRDLFRGTEIHEKKVGIVGVGRLGQLVAGYFKALGASVYGFDRREIDPSVCIPVSTVEEVVETCDIVSIHLSYQSDTHHFFNEALFSRMKTTAVLINTARGAIVDSDSLLHALRTKAIAGAALDVLENEFDVKNNPLIQYARENHNLIITPHIGGNTAESFRKTELFMVSKLKALWHELI
jgi:D-3-phosphoglycerate dehydrogenase / 2-oxoglutarate reductase